MVMQKSEIFLNQKNVKITKWEHDFKGFGSPFNVEILNSLKPWTTT